MNNTNDANNNATQNTNTKSGAKVQSRYVRKETKTPTRNKVEKQEESVASQVAAQTEQSATVNTAVGIELNGTFKLWSPQLIRHEGQTSFVDDELMDFATDLVNKTLDLVEASGVTITQEVVDGIMAMVKAKVDAKLDEAHAEFLQQDSFVEGQALKSHQGKKIKLHGVEVWVPDMDKKSFHASLQRIDETTGLGVIIKKLLEGAQSLSDEEMIEDMEYHNVELATEGFAVGIRETSKGSGKYVRFVDYVNVCRFEYKDKFAQAKESQKAVEEQGKNIWESMLAKRTQRRGK